METTETSTKGSNQEIIIHHIENYYAAVTTVTNHYYGTRVEETKTQVERKAIDVTAIRTDILNYVDSIRSFLREELQDNFIKMWEGILNLDIVGATIYNPGKQQGTTFNRNLVARIIHYLDGYRIYKDNYNAAELAMALEGDKEHSVRAALGKYPTDDIVTHLDRFMNSI